ncbi:MAG: enoyl-CoA hydratase/isomerase family protein [Chloroflexi bacterium]|nr:enoyl-CoA hydratase/isomerase family protein [Chloroflexota bacterium]
MDSEELIVTQNSGVVLVTLNRPDNMNSLSAGILERLPRLISEIREDDSAKVLVITGAGQRAFCAGADVGKRLATGATFESTSRNKLIQPIGYWLPSLVNLPKPTIAAVNGTAAGAGLTLALACDMRIASRNARFSTAFIKRGMIPDGGTTKLLPEIVGLSHAYLLMYTGDAIDAERAERIGLVNQVVPPEDLMKVATDLATRLASGPSVAIELTKRAVLNGRTSTLESQLDFETRAQGIVRGTDDFKEGIASFLEKRPPNFQGK